MGPRPASSSQSSREELIILALARIGASRRRAAPTWPPVGRAVGGGRSSFLTLARSSAPLPSDPSLHLLPEHSQPSVSARSRLARSMATTLPV